jgi:hypothetical protein
MLILGVLAAKPTVGDRLSYGEIRDLHAEGADLVIDHHHDWSEHTYQKRYAMILSHQNPFTSENDYAFISVRRRDNGALLFQRPSPALTWIGATSDSRYIIGLSEIKLYNPYWFVIFDRAGRLIAKHRVSETVACFTPTEYVHLKSHYANQFQVLQDHACASYGQIYIDFMRIERKDLGLDDLWTELVNHRCSPPFAPNTSGSVTNWVYWFDSKNPDPEIVEQEGEPIALSVTDPEGSRITIPFACEKPRL